MELPAYSLKMSVPVRQKVEHVPEYTPGVPMWVDLSSSDLDKSRAFYSGLFGWDAQVVPDPQAGGYTMFFLDGKMVAAASLTFDTNQHPAWSTYVCSANADATVKAATDAGGEVLMGPMDVMGQGRMAVLKDPTGAHISIWQPQAHRGAELVNDSGSFCWNELYTRDVPAARDFYQKVLAWDAEESESSVGPYTVFQVSGRSIAGGLDMSSLLPDSIPPHWLVYFTVINVADAAATSTHLGGTLVSGPMDTPMGPFAVIQDPVGAAFAIIRITPQS